MNLQSPPDADVCVAREMWDRLKAGYNVNTAQGRTALDRALRAEIAKIEDDDLRAHCGEMIRRWRKEAYDLGEPWEKITALTARVDALEAKMEGVQ